MTTKNLAKASCSAALIVLVALSGCAAPEPVFSEEEKDQLRKAGYLSGLTVGRDEGYAEAEAKFNPPQEVVAQRTSRATIDIEPGGHHVFTVNATRSSEVEYYIKEYTGVYYDVIWLRERDYYALYQDGEEPRDYFASTCTDFYVMSLDRDCYVLGGTWFLVLDNTEYGAVAPIVDEEAGLDGVLRMQIQYLAYTVG